MGDKKDVIVTLNGVPMTEVELKRCGLDISSDDEESARRGYWKRRQKGKSHFPSQCSCGFGGRSRHPKHRTRCY